MMTLPKAGAVWLIAATCLQTVIAGTALQHDPFARPLLSVTSVKSASAPAVAGEATAPWNPPLVAVMVAGRNSMANVDGTILRVGEEVDGYRLVQVRDQEAIFTKSKQRVVLKMEATTRQQNMERATQ